MVISLVAFKPTASAAPIQRKAVLSRNFLIVLSLIAKTISKCEIQTFESVYNYLLTQVQSLCADMEKASSEILYFFDHRKQELKK